MELKLVLRAIFVFAICLTRSLASVNRNEYVELGTTVFLKCSNTTIAWNDMIFVIWKIHTQNKECMIAVAKNDSDHDTCHDGKKQSHTADGTYHLIIPKFSVQDEGSYTCDTSYQAGGSLEIVRVSAWDARLLWPLILAGVLGIIFTVFLLTVLYFKCKNCMPLSFRGGRCPARRQRRRVPATPCSHPPAPWGVPDPSETDIVAPEPSFVGGRRSELLLGGGRRSELLLGGGRHLALLLGCGRRSALLLGCGRRLAPPLGCGHHVGPFGLAVVSFAPPTWKGRELADMMERRKVDILCVQETRWKGSKARSIGAGFKLFYYGVDSKRNGVGVVLKEEFVRNVLEVKRVSDRMMSLKLEIEGVMLNVVSGYAPQVGCELEEKERFWSELDKVMESIPTGERVVIGADFNGHVGEGNTGDEEAMGKFGLKERNLEGQMVVDFAGERMQMAVVNTYFQKREEHRVPYKSGGRRTQVDYILCRRGNLKEISDCKVVVGESVARQHRMMVCRMTLMVYKKKRSKIEIEKKTKW
ncbi:hypothetical protein QTP86_030087 [Hemibagrus guttatus]|nr:hypothetical protein QTP86_030087 [Hemibagrus guttatus]